MNTIITILIFVVLAVVGYIVFKKMTGKNVDAIDNVLPDQIEELV